MAVGGYAPAGRSADGVRVFPGVRELLGAADGQMGQAIASGSTGAR